MRQIVIAVTVGLLLGVVVWWTADNGSGAVCDGAGPGGSRSSAISATEVLRSERDKEVAAPIVAEQPAVSSHACGDRRRLLYHFAGFAKP